MVKSFFILGTVICTFFKTVLVPDNKTRYWRAFQQNVTAFTFRIMEKWGLDL